MNAFKKTLAALTAVLMLTGVTPGLSAGAATVQNEPQVISGEAADQQSSGNNNSGGAYVEDWEYNPDAAKAKPLAAVGADSDTNTIELQLKAYEKKTGNKVSIPGATACLYIGSKLKRSIVDSDNDGVVKMPIGDLTKEELHQATVSAYKKTAEGKAMDGTARDSVYNAFKNDKGKIIRYEYELHSETVDDNGNWVGVDIATGTKADVVFAIDATGSMGDEINSVKDNIASFTDTLIKSGLDVRFSVIEYRDIAIGEPTKIHTFKGSRWTSSLSDVTGELSKIRADGGGDTPETPFDALGAVASDGMNWRSDAQKCAFLFTDADYKTNNNYGFSGISDLAQALKKKKICTSVITSSSYKSTYSTLYSSTNGIYGNINSSFYSNMQSLAENILAVGKRKIELTLREPRIKYNLTVCYLANDDDSKSSAYKSSMRTMLQQYADDIAQTSDGHVLINKVYLFSTNNRLNFFNTSSNASKADIQIQTTETERNSSSGRVQVHSNAYPNGYYFSSTVSSDASIDMFKSSLDSSSSYRSKKTYLRIQMSAVEGADWNNSFSKDTAQYATTVTHESGHYIFGFYDEYGYEDPSSGLEPWNSTYTRPGGRYFGLMDNQHKDIEMSKRSIDYSGLACLTNKQWYNSPAQYYNNNMPCEDYLASRITNGDSGITDFSLGNYLASYDKVTAGYDRTASYPWFSIQFVSATGKVTAVGAEDSSVGADAGTFDAMTVSSDKISDAEYSVSGSTFTLSLTPQSGKTYEAYYISLGRSEYTAITSTKKSGKLNFNYTLSKDKITEIRLVEKGASSRYVSYLIDTSPSVSDGYIYESSDGTTIAYENVSGSTSLVHVSDSTKRTQSGYVSVNSATYITADKPANIDNGEIYSVASCTDDIDYTSVSWFVYRNGRWTKLDTDLTSEENKNIGARADTDGAGLYVLMAKKASTASVSPATNLKYTADKTKDGRIVLTFTDKNTNSKFYRVYVSEKAISSTDGVLSYVFDAEASPSITLNLDKINKNYYIAVEIISDKGAKSTLSKLTVKGEEADRDGDGIPDSYCDKYSLWGDDGEDKDIAGSDDDGDGLTNLEEYLRGSDPTNPNDPVATLPVPVEDITISASKKTIALNSTFTLTSTITPADATNKTVLWSTDNASVLSLTPSGSTCKVKGIFTGTASVYAVTDDGGFSAECVVTVSTSATVSAPQVSKLESAYQGVKLTWAAVDGAYGYRVFRKNGSSWKAIGTTTAATYTDTSVTSGTKYTYTVRCIDKDNKYISSYKKEGWSHTFVAAPKNVKFADSSKGVTLTWDKVTGAYGYRVFRKDGSSWKAIGTTTATSYTDSTAVSGTSYTYTVRCIDKNSKYISGYYSTGWSHTFSYSSSTLATPRVTSIANAVDGAKLTWAKVTGAYGYRVFRKNGSSWKAIATTTAATYTDTSVTSGTTYLYTVRCVDKNGKYVSSYNKTGWSHDFIAAPKITKFEDTSSGVKITWGKVAGTSGYRVFRKNGSSWKAIGTTTALYFIDTGAANGSTYTYTVRCVDSANNYISAYHTAGWNHTFKKPSLLAAPAITKLESTAQGVKITWGKVTGAYGYRVFYKSGSNWKALGNTSSTTFTDTSVRPGASYTYTVRCIDKDGNYTSNYDKTGKTCMYTPARR